VCLGLISLLWAHSFAKRREGRFSNWSGPPRPPLQFRDVLDANFVFLVRFYTDTWVPIQQLTSIPSQIKFVHTPERILR
jgi:hypothetical protein